MKLLLDQNLSYRLIAGFGDLYPQSTHVREVGLAEATDEEMWRFAHANSFAIVSKDSDFRQRSFLRGHPPKVIWIRRGNCSTDDASAILHGRYREVESFGADVAASLLALE